ncbi:MAG: NADP-dependent oxidoreductase [Anaerolineae bacterium]
MTAPESHFALKPGNVDHAHAAAIPLAVLTAWQGLMEAVIVQQGQRVLVHAAAGGVGHLALQIAKWRGAYVIGTASARNFEYVRSLGADEVIDYSVRPFEEVVEPVDIVFDTYGGDNIPRSFSVVKSGGSLVTIAGSPDQNEAAARGIHAKSFLVRVEESQLAQIADLMASGHLKVTVDHVFPLAEAGKAHALSAGGHVRGKIVLQV